MAYSLKHNQNTKHKLKICYRLNLHRTTKESQRTEKRDIDESTEWKRKLEQIHVHILVCVDFQLFICGHGVESEKRHRSNFNNKAIKPLMVVGIVDQWPRKKKFERILAIAFRMREPLVPNMHISGGKTLEFRPKFIFQHWMLTSQHFWCGRVFSGLAGLSAKFLVYFYWWHILAETAIAGAKKGVHRIKRVLKMLFECWPQAKKLKFSRAK